MLFVLYILVFFLLFGPKVGELDFISVFSLVTLVFIKTRIKFLAYFLLLAIYATVVILVNESYATQYIFTAKFYRVLLNVLGVIGLFQLFDKSKITSHEIINIICTCIAIHGAIMFLEVLIPKFHEIIISLSGDRRGFRVSGLTAGFGTTSILMCFPIIVYLVDLILVNESRKYHGIKVLLCVLGLIGSGRIGPYLMLVILPLILFIICVLSYKLVIKTRLIYIVFVIFIVSTLSLILAYGLYVKNDFIMDLIGRDSLIRLVLQSMLEPLISLFKDNTFDSRTSSEFSEMSFLYFNSTIFEVLFGSGWSGRYDEFMYLQTDIGYALYFSFFGVIGLLFCLLTYIYPICLYRKIYAKYYYYLLFITLLTVLGNYKQVMLYSRNLFSLQIMLTLIVLGFKGRYDAKIHNQ
ncbi:hypothetical protein KW428_18590 [Vibrio fluvialis]|nr:hypothetical protein [Vibrio fluvialis]